MVTLETHPAATLFPLMTEDEYQGLKADIAENGQLEDVVLYRDQILDGRNRLRACEELGLEPMYTLLGSFEDPWKYVISHNLHRRHLTTSQRAMVASKLATLEHGDVKTQKSDGQNCPSSIEDAAKALNVSPRSVKTAKKVQEAGSESVKQAVEQGDLPVSTAAKLVKKIPDKKEQSKIVAQGAESIRAAVATKSDDVEWVDADDEEASEPKEDNKLAEFKKFWNRCSKLSQAAIRVWVSDQS